MRIIAISKIIEYYTGHPDAGTALEDWYQKVKNRFIGTHAEQDVIEAKKYIQAMAMIQNEIAYKMVIE